MKEISFVDTTLRDGHQSLWATRMKTAHMIPIAPLMDRAGFKIAELMDCLKEMAVREGVYSPEPQIATLHETFLKNIMKRGRLFEGTFLPTYMLRSSQFLPKWKDGTWINELKLGWQMFYKGRFSLFPKTIKGKKEIRAILKRFK